MANLPISELPLITGNTLDDLVVVVQNGITSKESYKDFLARPTIDGGQISGAISVDLSISRWYKFELTGNVQISFTNGRNGETYLFWIYSNGNYSVDGMTYSGGDVFSQLGMLPNPTNNAWNLYQAYTIGNDLILVEHNNFSAI